MKQLSEITYQGQQFIIKDMIKENGLYSLIARPKVGKSFLALQLAHAVVNGTEFLEHETNKSPVLYVSTEVSAYSLKERMELMNYDVNTDFFLITSEENYELLNINTLEKDFIKFKSEHNGKLVIIDMLYGIDVGVNYDINNYQDMGQKVFPKLRSLCNKYGLTILFVHHLNKNGTALGSTAIDTSVDGKFTLKQNSNIKSTFYLEYESRDFKGIDFVLYRDDNMNLQIDNTTSESLNPHLITFLNYAISEKEFSFTVSEITSKLNLYIIPSEFGKLLKNNITTFEKLGLHIEQKRTANERRYYAKFEEPISD